MANVVYQNDAVLGIAKPQTSTDGAADVNVASGAVGFDNSAPGVTNAATLAANPALGASPTNATTVIYAASLPIKNGPGKLFGFSGFNSKGSAQWIQIHDSATLPAEAAVPKVIVYAAATANFSFDAGVYGREFLNGMYMVNSSTGPTKTIGSADVWFDGQYK